VVSQPSTVDALVGAALDAGATTIKPVKKGLWGYGGMVCAPDGTIWKIATSAKKDTGPATRQIDPGRVFDLELPLERAAEGYRAMDERRAIKALLRPMGR
jgi:hypothetical protein